MLDDFPDDYLAGLPLGARNNVARVNRAGIRTLRDYLGSGEAIAFLGSAASGPIYPRVDGILDRLLASASGRLNEHEAEALAALSKENPEEVAEILRRQLGSPAYLAELRDALRAPADSHMGRTWTPVQELVCQCNFKGVVTTAYDPGIIDARMRIRQHASGTGFMTWQDELGLDGWRTGDVFDYTELPVLYAHGHQGQPDSVLLSATDFQRAYVGKLPATLRQLLESGHVIWIGFSFADQQIGAIIREAAGRSGTRLAPGAAPRHIAILPWDPAAPDNHPGLLARRSEISYGASAILYPAVNGDPSALVALLSALTDSRYPAFSDWPVGSAAERDDRLDYPSTSSPSRLPQSAVRPSVRHRRLFGCEDGAGTSVDRTAGVQFGSGNIQVNYFYGNQAGADSDGTLSTSHLAKAADAPYQGHAFISYGREDSDEVDMVQRSLETNGVPVWRDTASLWPGEDWQAKVRGAITEGALVFVACFSSHSTTRRRGHQHEELLLAIDQLRSRPTDTPWLIPVRFDDCVIPDLELGSGRTLGSIQRVDLFGANRAQAVGRLVAEVRRVLPQSDHRP
jgi:hypothetical protein